eukprot:SAG25_NODE_6516_length_553_cov_2.378855_1_plen_81_part_10
MHGASIVHDGRWGDDTVHITNTRRQLQAVVRQGGNASAALNHGERGTTTDHEPSHRAQLTRHTRSLAPRRAAPLTRATADK